MLFYGFVRLGLALDGQKKGTVTKFADSTKLNSGQVQRTTSQRWAEI